MIKEGIVLVHKISKDEIEVDKAKVVVIAKLPHPTIVKGIRSFLSHAGFYRRFIKYFSKIARPMTCLLEKDTSFFFSKECIKAFQTLKRKLTEAPILIAPDWDLPFEHMCDASDFAIGVVLWKRQENHFRPIHYASKTMTEAESNYTTTEKEMLAVVYAFEKFWSYLIMNKRIVYTVIPPSNMSLLRKIPRRDCSDGFYSFKSLNSKTPLTFSRLATMDPPGDIMARTTPPRRCLTMDSIGLQSTVMPTTWSNLVTLVNVKERFRNEMKCLKIPSKKVMLKYGVTHRLATAYHPQTSGQVEISNRGLKRILERTLGCTPYKLVYEKACHLPIELENKAYWALKHAKFDLQTAGDHKKVQPNELNELRDQAYENSMIYKEKTKRLHDSKIKDRVFNVSDQVLLFKYRLKIFL
nr:reverse transcriptase domain-containing protein [Tanacetum cinerariifolium]